MTVSVKTADGAEKTFDAELAEDGKWSARVPAGTLADGEHRVEASASDKKGRSSTASVIVHIDTRGPTVLVSVPASYGTGAEAFTTSDSITVKGETWDPSPLSRVELQILNLAGDVLATKTAEGTASWSAKLAYGPGKDVTLADGEYRFVVNAYDRAGNRSTRFFHVQDVWETLSEGVSTSDADMDTIGKADQQGGSFPGDWPQVVAGAFTAFPFLVNSQVPLVAITTPTEGSKIIGAATTASGTATVTGARVVKILWAMKEQTGAPDDTAAPTDDSAWSTANYSGTGSVLDWSFAIELSGTVDKTYGIFVKAVDAGGNASEAAFREFDHDIDTDAPTVVFSSVTPVINGTYDGTGAITGGTVNGAVVVKGTAADDNALKAAGWRIGGDIGDTAGFTAFSGNLSSWSFPVDTTALPDAAPTSVFVRAEDSIGNARTFELPLSVDQSTDLPTAAFQNFNAAPIPADAALNLLETNALVIASAADDDAVDKNAIHLSVDGGAYAPVSLPPTVSASQVSFRSDLSALAEGVHFLRIRVADTFGNTSFLPVSGDVYFAVDRNIPALAFDQAGQGLFVRGNSSVVLTGTASDTNGLKRWTDPINGDQEFVEIDTGSGYTQVSVMGGAWSYDLSTLGMSSGTLTVSARATDTYGKTNTQTYTLTVDADAPTVVVSGVTPVSNDTYDGGGSLSGGTVNGEITIKGTTYDANPLATVAYRFGGDLADTTGYTDFAGNLSSWTIVKDTTELVDKATTVLFLRARDGAGNETIKQVDLFVDQDTDKPVVRLSSLDPRNADPKANRMDSVTLALEIVDDDGIAANALALSFSSDGGATWSAPATATHSAAAGGLVRSVSYTLSGAAAAEGAALRIRASVVDVNGVSGDSFTATDSTLHADAAYWVDLGAPTIDFQNLDGALYSGGTAYRKVAYALSGAVVDGSAVASVLYSLDGTTYTPVDSFGSGSWTNAFTASVNGIYLRAADEFGKTTTTSRIPVSVVYDIDPPTAAISVPASHVSTETAYWKRGTHVFSGTAADNAGGSGVSSVRVAVTAKGASPLPADWSAAALNGGTWSFSYDASAASQGEKTLHVAATDLVANESVVAARDFGVDLDDPTLADLEADGSAYSALIYRTGGSVTLTGTAADTQTVATVTVEEKVPGGAYAVVATLAAPASSTSYAWTWTKTFGGADAEGVYDYRIVVRDVAGNVHTSSTAATVSVHLDRTAPAAPTVTAPTAGAYYGEDSTVLRGTASDASSGVASVEWSADGGAAWYAADGTTSWTRDLDLRAGALNPVIALRDQGQKEILVRATDLAGNVSGTASRVFWLDREAPAGSFASPAANARINGSADVAVQVAASDANGVSSVVFKVASSDFSAPDASAALNAGYWEATIPAAAFSALGTGASSIRAQVRDNAGRTSTVTLPIQVDKTPPTVSFSAPAAATTVNRTIAVSGTASDDQALLSVRLEIANADDSSWTTLATFTGSGSYNWSFPTFDTVAHGIAANDHDLGASGVQIRLRAVATDEAGNVNAAPVVRDLTVDQDSDRPVIKLTNLAAAGTTILKLTRTVFGTVTDDDGTLVSFSVSEDNTNWTALTLDGGNWSYDASAGDGAKTLYFRAADSGGTTFSTDAAAEPRVQNGAGYWETAVGFRVDTVTPEIEPTISADRASPYGFEADSDTFVLTTNQPFGGPTGRFSVRILARDANGIASVTANVPGLGTVATSVIGSAVAYPGYTAFATDEIDVTALGDGAKDISLTVTDGSGLAATATRTVVVDNTAPTLTFLTPDNASIVNGELSIKGTASDATTQLESVTYRLGRNYVSESASAPSGSTYLWEIPFTGTALLDLYANGTESYIDTSTGVTLYILPVVVRGVDKAGNVRETVPIGGTASRPTTTSLVSASLVGNSRIAVGQVAVVGAEARVIAGWNSASGTVSWSGSVSLSETAFTILEYSLRIDPEGDAPKASISYPETGATLGGNVRIYGSALDDDGVGSVWMQIDTDQDGSFTAADDSIGNWYNGGIGRQVTGASNWNQTINTGGEFNPAGSDPTRLLVRVRAQDIYGTYGPWSTPIEILIDKNVPVIGSAYSLRLDPDGDPNNGNEIPYTYGMYLKGNWTLRGSIEDETALESVSLAGDLSGTLGSKPAWFTLTTAADAPNETKYKRIDLNVPIASPADTAAVWNFTIAAQDVSEPAREASQALRLNIDTKAPTAALNALVSPPTVQQSNGWYKVKGTAVDDGSDVDRVEVYFIRRDKDNATLGRMYNPASANVSMPLTAFTIGADGAPVKAGTADSRTTTSLTDDALIGNTLIAVGKKIDIGLNRRTIGSWNAASGTIAWADGEVDAAITDYSVRLAASVDHKDIVESWNAGVVNDDGDGFVEYLKQDSGTTYTWFLDVKSDNIPDGPIEIHYVVFDSSGNATAYQTAGYKVQNNGPRIAALWLGTDLNTDASIDESVDSLERELFAFSDATTDGLTATTSFKVKEGPMYILPVITNGNGDLVARLSAGPTAASLAQIGGDRALRTGGTVSPILLDAAALATVGEGTRTFRLAVWDSTEETTAFVDSLSLTRDVVCLIATVDTAAPESAVAPFYWNSATDNSLYGNSRANGHIELSGVYDGTDPDVSGKISVRGTARDDQRLTAIWMHIDGFAFPGAGASKTAFDIDADGDADTLADTYYLVATYSGGVWTAADQWTDDGWKFTVSPVSLDQAGHEVSWRLDWDSSKVTGVAAADRNIRVVAEDKRTAIPNASPESAVQTSSGALTPLYTVDVVPYITGISRSTDYETIRSRFGRYVLARGETVTLSGFNVYAAGSTSLSFGVAAATISAGTPTSFTSTVPATASSGAVSLSVNGVTAPNNSNLNTEEYNKENSASISGSDLWTDDRYVHIWVSNNNQTTANFGYFAESSTPYYPAMTYNNGTLYASWSNYSTASIYYNTNANATRSEIFHGYDPSEHTDISYNAFGNRPTVVYNANLYGNNTWDEAGAGGVQIWDANAPNNADGSGTWQLYEMEELYHDQMLMQFTNQRIVSSGLNNYSYVSYYDTDTKALKFAMVKSGDTGNAERWWINVDGGSDADDAPLADLSVYGSGGTVRTVSSVSVTVGQFVDAGDPILTQSNGAVVNATASGIIGSVLAVGASVRNTIVAAVIQRPNGIVDEGGASRSAAAGEYSSIALNPNGYPVIAYYDATNQTVKIAHASSTTPGVSQWKLQTAMSTGDASYRYSGKYISMKIDGSGYLHMAFYRNSTGDLIYMKSTNAPTDGLTDYTFGSSVVVDSIGSVGSGADITLSGTVPYISYYDSSYYDTFNGIKLAYYDTVKAAWEYMNAPLVFNVGSDIRTSVEYNSAVAKTAGAASTSTAFWAAAIGYKSDDFYRIAYYAYGD